MSDRFNAAFLIERAEDVGQAPTQWVAHCLTLDVVTQGDSVAHAFDMLQEAVQIVVDDDRKGGACSIAVREPAPVADWQRFERAVERGDLDDAIPDWEVGAVTGWFHVDDGQVQPTLLLRMRVE